MFTARFWCVMSTCVWGWGDFVCARAARACLSLCATFPRGGVRAQCSFVASLLWVGLRMSITRCWCAVPTCVCMRLLRARPRPRRRRRCGVASRWCGGRAAAAAASCCARGIVPSGLNNSRASASCAPAGTPAFACLFVSPSRGGVSGRGDACDGGRAIDCVRARPPLTWNNRWRALAGERCARLNCPACSLRGNAIIARARTRTQHVPARLRTLKFNFPSWPPIRLRNVATRCS